jgi:hypothetical protein
MFRSWIKKRVLAALAGAGLAVHLAACGTILHPERRGQPAGRLDWGVVVLDAVGLLLFFVPGVIAFAVDFTTGAIYLPPESAALPPDVLPQHLRTIRLSPAELTPERLSEVIEQQTGRSVRLEPGSYRATRINQLNEFSEANVRRLQETGGAGHVAFPRP